MNTSKQETKEANKMNMNKFNLTYESKKLRVPLTVTVLAYSIKTAAAEFHNFAGFLRIIKIEAAK